MEIIILPLILSLLAAFAGSKINKTVWGLLSFVSLFAMVYMKQHYGIHNDGVWHNTYDVPWFSNGIHFTLGIDGLTGLMILLTNLLVPIIILSIQTNNQKSLIPLILFMQAALNGVFMAKDGLMFYIFWELALIPIYFICLLYSSKDAFKTTIKFFIYTFIGSLAMLASLIYLYLKTENHSFAYDELLSVQLNYSESIWVGAGFLFAFAVKIPIFPFHSWQANTYTNAPAQGSMLLSGIMLKMGLYGLLRWFMPMAGESIAFFQPIVILLAVIGIIYGAVIAIKQNDLKRLIAFSSLSHVGLIAAGFMTLSAVGIQGGVLQMFVHGINVVALFYIVEIIEKHAGSRELSKLGGLAKFNRLFAALYLIVVLGTAAVPLTNGFPGELLLLKSVFDYNTITGVFAGLTIILCAVYMLRMYQFSMLGEGKASLNEIGLMKMIPLLILVALVIFIGVCPQLIIDQISPSIQKIMLEISNSKGVLS